nr:MAG: hypothetical protein DIU70_11505 [Bacillota bacterium]
MELACGKVRRHLGSYLARELPPDLAGQVEGHLRRCAACRRELERERRLFLALADPRLQAQVMAAPPPLPGDFTARVMARIRAEGRRRKGFWGRLAAGWVRWEWSSVAYGLSACLMLSAGSSPLVRSRVAGVAAAWLAPILDRVIGLWADLVARAAEHSVALKLVLLYHLYFGG